MYNLCWIESGSLYFFLFFRIQDLPLIRIWRIRIRNSLHKNSEKAHSTQHTLGLVAKSMCEHGTACWRYAYCTDEHVWLCVFVYMYVYFTYNSIYKPNTDCTVGDWYTLHWVAGTYVKIVLHTVNLVYAIILLGLQGIQYIRDTEFRYRYTYCTVCILGIKIGLQWITTRYRL